MSKPLSPRERGWGEGTERSARAVEQRQASHVPSSAPSWHLLPHEGGQCPGGRRNCDGAAH
ncbi:hypothetical protein B1H32_13055 [Xanthomonas vasicola pv. vasculorum]|nr:hypothetical protein B1H32_13055 [Xanthomonas vasicola pv. vasculorum]